MQKTHLKSSVGKKTQGTTSLKTSLCPPRVPVSFLFQELDFSRGLENPKAIGKEISGETLFDKLASSRVARRHVTAVKNAKLSWENPNSDGTINLSDNGVDILEKHLKKDANQISKKDLDSVSTILGGPVFGIRRNLYVGDEPRSTEDLLVYGAENLAEVLQLTRSEIPSYQPTSQSVVLVQKGFRAHSQRSIYEEPQVRILVKNDEGEIVFPDLLEPIEHWGSGPFSVGTVDGDSGKESWKGFEKSEDAQKAAADIIRTIQRKNAEKIRAAKGRFGRRKNETPEISTPAVVIRSNEDDERRILGEARTEPDSWGPGPYSVGVVKEGGNIQDWKVVKTKRDAIRLAKETMEHFYGINALKKYVLVDRA